MRCYCILFRLSLQVHQLTSAQPYTDEPKLVRTLSELRSPVTGPLGRSNYGIRRCREWKCIVDFRVTWWRTRQTTEYTEWQCPLYGVHSIMMVKSAQPEWGWGCTVHGERCTVHALPLSLYLPSRSKLWWTLQLRGQIYSHYFSSTPICTLWVKLYPYPWKHTFSRYWLHGWLGVICRSCQYQRAACNFCAHSLKFAARQIPLAKTNTPEVDGCRSPGISLLHSVLTPLLHSTCEPKQYCKHSWIFMQPLIFLG